MQIASKVSYPNGLSALASQPTVSRSCSITALHPAHRVFNLSNASYFGALSEEILLEILDWCPFQRCAVPLVLSHFSREFQDSAHHLWMATATITARRTISRLALGLSPLCFVRLIALLES